MFIADDEFIERVIKKMLQTKSFKTKLNQVRDFYNSTQDKLAKCNEKGNEQNQNNLNYGVRIKRKRG